MRVFRLLGLALGVGDRRGEEAFVFHPPLGEHLAEALHELLVLREDFAEHCLVDLPHLAVGAGDDGGAAGLAGEEGHLAAGVAGAQRRHAGVRPIRMHEHVGLAIEEDEHGVALLPLHDHAFATAEAQELGVEQELIHLRLLEELEHGLLAHAGLGGGERVVVLHLGLVDLEGADGEGNAQAAALGLIPDVGADGVADVVEARFVIHRELDLVEDGGVAEVLEEDLHGRGREHAGGAGGGAHHAVFDEVWRCAVVEADGDAHGVLARRVGEIRDGGADDRLVRDVEVDVVVGAQPGGAPVHLDDFGVLLVHDEPVAGLEGLADLERDAGDDIGERLLHGKAEHHRRRARRGEGRRDVRGVAKVEQDPEQRRDEEQHGEDLPEEFRGLDLLLALEPALPEIPVHECQDEEGREHCNRRSEMPHPRPMLRAVNACDEQRQPDGQRHGEELIHHAERDAVTALQPAPESDGDDIQQRDGDGDDGG